MANPYHGEFGRGMERGGPVKKGDEASAPKSVPMRTSGWKAPNVAGTRRKIFPTHGRKVAMRTNEDY